MSRKRKPDSIHATHAVFTVRVPRAQLARFHEIVASEHRTANQELRRFIEMRVTEADARADA